MNLVSKGSLPSARTHSHECYLGIALNTSEEGKYVAQWAVDHIARPGQKVYLFHVFVPTSIMHPRATPDVFHQQERKHAEEKFNTFLTPIAGKLTQMGCTFEAILLTGEVKPSLLAAIEHHDIDHLVIGADEHKTGVAKLTGMLHGSRTDHLMHKVSCPVTVVRQKCKN
mmetsp:Transcript_34970/g.79741  ORF Transcript_34970/g.79741 Transcript_34970/m.79741 type:complete len:169 (+) Transcript_34970:256-762(+)